MDKPVKMLFTLSHAIVLSLIAYRKVIRRFIEGLHRHGTIVYVYKLAG